MPAELRALVQERLAHLDAHFLHALPADDEALRDRLAVLRP